MRLLFAFFSFLLTATAALAGLTIADLGKEYTPPADLPAALQHPIPRNNEVLGGNTSVRNVAAAHLEWKGDASPNGFGYFQRNRDLGQVFNVPPGSSIKLDALVLRTSRGNNAVMAGASGARMYLQFFEVLGEPGKDIRIDENGTPVGTRATHGFDLQYNRADDFLVGATYRPIARVTGGVMPQIPPTTQTTYRSGKDRPFGEQPGHLRYLRFDLTDGDELVLAGGKRYAFMLGFESPAADRGLAFAITTKVHAKEPPAFVTDALGVPRWGLRREGNGQLPPTMTATAQEPTDPELRARLIRESLFGENHWDTLRPTTDGYPDVDTYRTMQFYLEIHRDR